MRPLLPLVLVLTACPSLSQMPRDQPCLDAGYAIARRTYECTGDTALGNERFEQFRREFACIDLPKYAIDTGRVTRFIVATDTGATISPPDYFHCALAIDALACETVTEFGDDIASWLSVSDACPWVTRPRGAR